MDKPDRVVFHVLVLATAVGAAALRLPNLDLKLMHGDEAVHTYKFNELWQTGRYAYDPHEYHGPTVYYLTFPSMWLSGARDYAETTAATYRVVPLIVGVGLILLLSLVSDGIGRTAALIAGLLTAVSPAMVFYSRHYIQEMLLVFLSFLLIVAGWRYARAARTGGRRSWGWVMIGGVAIGAMHATKETCAIIFAAMLAALITSAVWSRLVIVRATLTLPSPPRGRGIARARDSWVSVVVALLVAAFTSVALFSVFFADFGNVIASLRTYVDYADRAVHGIHIHPWHYYLSLLTYVHHPGGPAWTEGLIIVLGLVGIVVALRGAALPGTDGPFLRFLAFYTLALTVLYSAIPYKTPWCAVGFLHGLILLAGVGAVALLRWAAGGFVRLALVSVVLIIGTTHLGVQAGWANHHRVYANDVRNPHVYAHPVSDVLKLTGYLEQLTAVHPDGRRLLVKVMVSNCWPLPWYLRDYPQVGYWETVPDNPDADVIIASTSLQEALEARQRGDYEVSTYGLRRDEVLLVYVSESLRDAFVRSLTGDATTMQTREP